MICFFILDLQKFSIYLIRVVLSKKLSGYSVKWQHNHEIAKGDLINVQAIPGVLCDKKTGALQG